MDPWLTIIVPVRLRSEADKARLSALLQSLLQVKGLREQARVLVVDNHPLPEPWLQVHVADYARDGWPFGYLHEPQPGAAQARNTGARRVDTPWVAFVDADETLPAHWLAAYRRVLESHRWRAEVVLYGVCRTRFEHYPAWFSRAIEWLFGGMRKAQEVSQTTQRPLRQMFSGNMLIHRLTFLEVGGFLPFLPRGEDTELGLRLECLAKYRGFLCQRLLYGITWTLPA